MPIIDHIDGPNRDIYLHADTADAEVRPVDIYKEMRTLRRNDENLRKYDLFLKAEGYVDKGGGSFTPILVTCLLGTRIIPYDATHVLTITGEIITDEGTSGVACFDRSGLSVGVEVDINYVPPQVEVIEIISGSGVTEQDKLDIAYQVWEEILTGATHDVATSAGKRIRQLAGAVIVDGFVQSSTANTAVITGVGVSPVDGAYDPAIITIVDGTGSGQTRLVLQYDGASRTVVIDRDWKIIPDATSEYIISSSPGREHVNEGLAQAGGANTITLNTLASDQDNAYIGQVVLIRSGLGEDQALRVQAYNGTTKVATMCDNWAVVPDNTSGYVMLPTSILVESHIASAVWSYSTRALTTFGTLVSDIWSWATRLLTGSGLTASEQAELTAIKERTDNLTDAPADVSDVPTAEENALELLDNQNAP